MSEKKTVKKNDEGLGDTVVYLGETIAYDNIGGVQVKSSKPIKRSTNLRQFQRSWPYFLTAGITILEIVRKPEGFDKINFDLETYHESIGFNRSFYDKATEFQAEVSK